jgi:hypothetical protein
MELEHDTNQALSDNSIDNSTSSTNAVNLQAPTITRSSARVRAAKEKEKETQVNFTNPNPQPIAGPSTDNTNRRSTRSKDKGKQKEIPVESSPRAQRFESCILRLAQSNSC